MSTRRPGRRPALLAWTMAATALLAPLHLHAQDPLGEPAREPARERVRDRDADRERCICFGDQTDRTAGPFTFRTDRGRIGVMLGAPTDVDGETGVRIEDVVTGGPADRAGLAAGDVLLAFDGEPLGDAPTRALLERMAQVEPGDTVALRYSRDQRQQTARVVVESDDRLAFLSPAEGAAAGSRFWTLPRVPGGADGFRWRMDAPPSVISIDRFGHGGLELVEMNDGLGRYFGVQEGVLVTDVEEDSHLGLQPGDVIVAVGDREVRSPRHARSIIGSYLPDEEISFRLVRDGRTLTVRGSRGRR